MDAPAGGTQKEGHTGFIHHPSVVLALIFIARRIQPFLYLVLFFVADFLYMSLVWPMGPDVLGYQSHLLQRCHPASVDTKDLPISPRFSPYDFFIVMQIQHSYNSSTKWLNFTYLCSRSHAFRY